MLWWRTIYDEGQLLMKLKKMSKFNSPCQKLVPSTKIAGLLRLATKAFDVCEG